MKKNLLLVLSLIIMTLPGLNLQAKPGASRETKQQKYINKAKGIGAGVLSGVYALFAAGAVARSIDDLGKSWWDSNGNPNSWSNMGKKLAKHGTLNCAAAAALAYCSLKLADYSKNKLKEQEDFGAHVDMLDEDDFKDSLDLSLEGIVCGVIGAGSSYLAAINFNKLYNSLSHAKFSKAGLHAALGSAFAYTAKKALPHSFKSLRSAFSKFWN